MPEDVRRKPSGKKGVAYTQNTKVQVGNLGKQIKILLDQYTDEVQEALKYAIPQVANETKKKVQQNAKAQNLERTGQYVRGWAVQKTVGVNFVAAVVHNKDRYRIAHLLEHGHVVKNGTGRIGAGKKTRVNGIEHIAPAEQWANEELAKIWDKLGI